ncbi:DUF4907 domain-containing protein [uncultured Chitinophaga sp.]|uniref:DUF4907 domain-containing protein n=1 Tax=uncultured Chitinophaga sp. TaxID=339340 RepID=UPI0025D13168|nr:DUF4907 domain-containing protein [uncultured Chitinophaga sp.]
MTKPKSITKWIVALTIGTLLLFTVAKVFFTSSTATHHHPAGMVQLEVVPFETAGGWGYKINAGGKTYISQDRIPVLEGKQPFSSKEDAIRVGDLIVKKLMQHQSPAISKAELAALQIQH